MSSLSIVADQQILFAKEAFSKFGDVELVDGRSIDQQVIKDADVLLVRSVTKVDKSLLDNSRIKFIGSATSGIDHVDTNYLVESNIAFSSAPGSNARSVAEYVLSSLFIIAEEQGFSLTDKSVGIIGYGQVGSRVRKFLETLGIKCLLNDPPLASKNCDEEYKSLDEVLQADIITLHVPLTENGKFPTKNLVNDSFLDKLKSDVVFINTSRGEVVDEKSLLAFSQKNTEATLVLDVWCNEPEIDINLLQKIFIATPHIAGYSYDGKLKATKMLATALEQHLNIELEDINLSTSDNEILTINDDVVQLAVLQSYDVRNDAIAMSDLINFDNKERGTYFDNQRKNYPIRREFTNRTIRTTKISNKNKQQLLQLGFNVEVI